MSNAELSYPKRNKLSLNKTSSKRNTKAKSWSHQDELKTLIGKRIKVVKTNGSKIFSTLLESDQFTIKVQVLAADPVNAKLYEKSEIITLTKHSVEAYSAAELVEE